MKINKYLLNTIILGLISILLAIQIILSRINQYKAFSTTYFDKQTVYLKNSKYNIEITFLLDTEGNITDFQYNQSNKYSINYIFENSELRSYRYWGSDYFMAGNLFSNSEPIIECNIAKYNKNNLNDGFVFSKTINIFSDYSSEIINRK